jgi:Tfp pilus assembly protein PilX
MKLARHQKGSLMLTAVIIIVILGAFGAVAIRTLTSNSISSSLAMAGLQTYYIAESGLEYGALDIKNNINLNSPATFCDGNWKTPSQTFGNGQFRYNCAQYIPSGVTITATITASSMIVPISTTTGMAPSGWITIGSEQIDYSAISTSTAICGTSPCLIVKKRSISNTNSYSIRRR